MIDTTILDRMVGAVEKVRLRLVRATRALEAAKVPYAVVGGNAVGAWVATVDETAVRNTQGVDILLRRTDLDSAKIALESNGFLYRHTAGLDVFLDGTTGKARDAVHVIFVNEKVRPTETVGNPDIDASERIGNFQVIAPAGISADQVDCFPRQRPCSPSRPNRCRAHRREVGQAVPATTERAAAVADRHAGRLITHLPFRICHLPSRYVHPPRNPPVPDDRRSRCQRTCRPLQNPQHQKSFEGTGAKTRPVDDRLDDAGRC